MKEKEVLELKKNYSHYLSLDISEMYEAEKVVGISTVRGKEAYHMKAIDSFNKTDVDLYFAKENKKLIAVYSTVIVDQGEIRAKVYTNSYKDVDGMSLPAEMESEMMGQSIVVRFDSYEFNAANPPRIAPPAVIRQLLKEQQESKGQP